MEKLGLVLMWKKLLYRNIKKYQELYSVEIRQIYEYSEVNLKIN